MCHMCEAYVFSLFHVGHANVFGGQLVVDGLCILWKEHVSSIFVKHVCSPCMRCAYSELCAYHMSVACGLYVKQVSHMFETCVVCVLSHVHM